MHSKTHKPDAYHHVLPVDVHRRACRFTADRVSSCPASVSLAQTGAEDKHAGTCFVLNWDIFGLLGCYDIDCQGTRLKRPIWILFPSLLIKSWLLDCLVVTFSLL